MKKLVFAIIGIGVVAASYWLSNAYFAKDASGDIRPRTLPPVVIESALVERRLMRETIVYPGSVEADKTVSVAPRISGIIEEIHVDFGDYVATGAPLVTIDDAEFVERQKQAAANVRLAAARLKKSEAQLEFVTKDFDRARQEAQDGVGRLQDLDTAVAAKASAAADVEVSRADLERMQAALDESELNVENTHIASPLSGWVQRRHVDPGALASPSSTILTIVDTDPALVVVYVPQREMHLADTGRHATVTTDSGHTFEGRVTRVAPSLSTSTRTTEVIVEVPNPDKELRPGMSADVTLIAREDPDSIVIPTEAIIYRQGRPSVYTVRDGMAYLNSVKTGIEESAHIQIIEGLEDGDRVVLKGQYLLKNAHPVTESSEESEGSGGTEDS